MLSRSRLIAEVADKVELIHQDLPLRHKDTKRLLDNNALGTHSMALGFYQRRLGGIKARYVCFLWVLVSLW